MIKLFVGGFPFDTTEMDLVKLLDPYVRVSTIKIVRDRATRKCKGYAFVETEDETGATDVMEALNGTEIDGRQLKLNIVTEADIKKAPARKPYFKARPDHSNPNKNRRPRLNR